MLDSAYAQTVLRICTTVLIERKVHPLVAEALAYSRVVFIQGARQVGKSTLAQQVLASESSGSSATLDDQLTRAAAAADPTGFIAGLPAPALIDEVQLVPDLLYAIKWVVDDDPTPGRFLLTGSANVLTAPKISESLAGRVRRIELWPLAQAEIRGAEGNFVDALFAGEPPWLADAPTGRQAFVELVARGGYPAVHRLGARQRQAWYRDYAQSIVERDLRDVASARKLAEMPKLLRLLASNSAQLLDLRKLARNLEISDKTAAAYIELLRTVFLVHIVPSWRPGLRARELHAPKVYFADTGLLAQQLGVDEERLSADDQVTGHALETFCGMEMVKHLGWASLDAALRHYRSQHDEIDIVLESRSGDLAAVEVKAGASPRERDWRVIAAMRDKYGDRFKAGVVLYTGRQTIPLGDRIWAVPVSGLWA